MTHIGPKTRDLLCTAILHALNSELVEGARLGEPDKALLRDAFEMLRLTPDERAALEKQT